MTIFGGFEMFFLWILFIAAVVMFITWAEYNFHGVWDLINHIVNKICKIF